MLDEIKDELEEAEGEEWGGESEESEEEGEGEEWWVWLVLLILVIGWIIRVVDWLGLRSVLLLLQWVFEKARLLLLDCCCPGNGLA